jgi:hypothetical protein
MPGFRPIGLHPGHFSQNGGIPLGNAGGIIIVVIVVLYFIIRWAMKKK